MLSLSRVPAPSDDRSEPLASNVPQGFTAARADSRGEPAAPAPENPVPAAASADTAGKFLVPGFCILVACLVAGETLKRMLGLILPGNILGLFILLSLLATGIVPLRWVEAAGRWLLFLLPLLFVPVFVVALKQAARLPQGAGYFAAVFCGVCLLWASIGHLAQRMLSRPASPVPPARELPHK